MENAKNSNWILIGALLFFLVSAGFTSVQQQSTSIPIWDCYICDAFGCNAAAEGQVGRENCVSDYPYCALIGPTCSAGPIEPT